MTKPLLNKSVNTLLLLFLVVAGLYYAQDFLIPVCFAGILAMLLLPVSRKLESFGWHRSISVLASVLLLLGILTGIISLLAWQISDLGQDIERMQGRVKQFIDSIQEFISDEVGITKTEQGQMLQEQQSAAASRGASAGLTVVKILSGFLADFILSLVYIFLFMYFRTHIKNFILRLVPPAKKEETVFVIDQSCHVSQQYLGGLASMIFCLWIMYSIGFSIVGVKNAFFFAVLCGILEIVPFVGNLTGSAFTALMAFVQGGGINMVVGVLITYSIVQFVQTYILEPLVVGAEVNINPLFTIIVLVLGEMLWGIPGMILAIPLTGILKIIMEHIEPLRPYAFLIGESKKKKESGLITKVKRLFTKKAA